MPATCKLFKGFIYRGGGGGYMNISVNLADNCAHSILTDSVQLSASSKVLKLSVFEVETRRAEYKPTGMETVKKCSFSTQTLYKFHVG